MLTDLNNKLIHLHSCIYCLYGRRFQSVLTLWQIKGKIQPHIKASVNVSTKRDLKEFLDLPYLLQQIIPKSRGPDSKTRLTLFFNPNSRTTREAPPEDLRLVHTGTFHLPGGQTRTSFNSAQCNYKSILKWTGSQGKRPGWGLDMLQVGLSFYQIEAYTANSEGNTS